MTKAMSVEETNKVLNTLPIAGWKYPKILLGVLLERSISYADQVFHQFMQIAAQGVPFIRLPYSRTDVARNKMATALLNSDYTHLIMLDIDHAHPINIVQQLSRWVMTNPERLVVGGLNFKRSFPHDACCFMLKDGGVYSPAEWDKGLIKVDAIGTGSILISREAFERIEPPWFFNLYDDAWRDEWPGEDMGFSQKCREAGIDMWVDTTCTSPHITDRAIDESDFREALKDRDADIVELKALQVGE